MTKKFRTLFWSTLCISAFTFGGGYVIVSVMKRKFVDELHWISEEEMLNLVAIAQSSPGAVAMNASVLVGKTVLGKRGAAVAAAGTLIPPLAIISALTVGYAAFRDNRAVSCVMRGMQSGIAAVIADTVITLGGRFVKGRDWIGGVIMAIAFAATYWLGVNVALLLVACGAAGAILACTRKEKRA